MDNVDSSVSDLVNMIILMGKYHINCSKWRCSPSFVWFKKIIKKFFFTSLKKIKSTKIARKMCIDISSKLLILINLPLCATPNVTFILPSDLGCHLGQSLWCETASRIVMDLP